ncbi:hypothetical protein NNC19_20455 [Clostridium sp. SHJSY1]|uniref:hypothetical protein n=1 Tax=Clostridium sp. SHJSY1 TaxID=2942483 RepID=UPI002873FDCD|nr:hypothetical protein [Clostridium sp. SHJSY1]MDS0528070.1 hypothetical protein [Clostridium sp. SHJSY1]
MKNKKIVSLTMATVMAISGGSVLMGCTNSKYDDFKETVQKQDKEDEEAENDNIFRGGYYGHSFFYVSGSGNSHFDKSTNTGWKSWSTKKSSASASENKYSSSKSTSFTG